MFSKLNDVVFFFALGFLALLVSASPIVLPLSEDISHFEDVVAREPIAVDVVQRDDILLAEVTDSEEVSKRDPVAPPNPEEEADVEARICRFSCL